MVRKLITLSVVVAVLAGAAVPALAQDREAWKAAVQRMIEAKENPSKEERIAAVKGVGEATFSDVDETTAKYVLEFLNAELMRSQGNKTEEYVSQEVLDACTEALRKIQDPKAIKYMIKMAPKGVDSRFGYHIIKALAGSASGDLHEDLVKLVDHSNQLIQAAAVEALVEEGKPSSLDLFIRVIGDVSKSFEVKIAALDGVRKLLRADDDASIDRLLDAMGKLPDSQRRVAAEIRDLLNGLLGMSEQGYDPNAWRSAIAQKKAAGGGGGAPGVGGGGGGGAPGVGGGGGGAPASGHKTVAEFFGIKTDSTRIIFCLDRTGSMADPCSDKKKEEKEKEREGIATGTEKEHAKSRQNAKIKKEAKEIKKQYDDREITIKMDAVKREYINCVYNLDEAVHFTTVWYNTGTEAWSTKLVKATWENKLSAIKNADTMEPLGGTNIFAAIDMAFKIMGEGKKPVPGKRPPVKTGAAVPKGKNAGADTIYVLTDGKHNAGQFTTGSGPMGSAQNRCDTSAFLGEVAKLNKHRKIIIHTICVGDPGVGADPPDPGFLRQLAEDNGGTFKHVSAKR
ncbi:MAG: hypothetical protein ACYTAF_01220 [Planctomycetota bacterium]|jgi:hypothetical protein